jgi:hypothetical protein
MESLFTVFLLFLAAITALISYLVIPYIPVVVLMTAAAVALAGGVWWHWTQFGVDYRTSTWQEQLRNYASYVMLLVVILLSYAFYVFAWGGSSLQDYATRAQGAIRNAGRKASSQLINSTSRASSALFSNSTSASEESSAAFNLGVNRALNQNRNRGFTGEPAYLD